MAIGLRLRHTSEPLSFLGKTPCNMLYYLAGNRKGANAVPSVPIPTIVERTPRGERSWDLFSRMLRERVILLGTPIDDEVASSIVAQLLFLQHADPERDIWFYINSPGGSVRDGLAIYDTMHLISCDVNTVCIGRAGSMATILLAGGTKGKRYALPNSTVHFHPAGGGAEGYARADRARIIAPANRWQYPTRQ
jgi:ATP-dependent Clp protease, protease subunit